MGPKKTSKVTFESFPCKKMERSQKILLFFLSKTPKESNSKIDMDHGLRTPSVEIPFTARSKINSHSQIFRCGRSIFCLPHPPKFSDFFNLCLHWVSIVCDMDNLLFIHSFGSLAKVSFAASFDKIIISSRLPLSKFGKKCLKTSLVSTIQNRTIYLLW